MLHRLFAFLALFALGSPLNAQVEGRGYPSLLKRPAEVRDGKVPELVVQAPLPPLPADADLTLQVARLSSLVTAGDRAFQQQVPSGRSAVTKAQSAAPSSEAWVNAQVAISSLDSARYESVAAMAGLDTLYVERQDNVDAARVNADLALIDPVRVQAMAMVDAQNDALDALRMALSQP